MKKVVSIAQKRAEFQFRQKENEFKNYLSKLKLNELRHEANYIIERAGEEDLGDEFLLKGALLMEELARRIEGDKMAGQVAQFADTLKEKANGKPTYH